MKKLLLSLLIVSILFTSCVSTEVEEPVVSVSGESELQISADIASFTLTLSALADESDVAFALLNEKLLAVDAILFDVFGLPKDDVSTTSLRLSPSYTYENGVQVLKGQEAKETLSIAVREIEKLSSLLSALSSADGITLSSVTLDSTMKDAAIKEAQALAVENAYEKATRYAAAAGLSVKDVITISENAVTATSARLAANDSLLKTASAESSIYYASSPVSVSAKVYVNYSMEK